MAQTALTQLQDQIEAVRREAYAAGYAAAMQAVQDFAARPAAETVGASASQRAAKAAPVAMPVRRGRRSTATAKPPRTARSRPQRGTNARLITEVLKAAGADFIRPAAIRTAIQNENGAAVAFTSIRHALGQLQARGEVEQSADGKGWRYAGA